MKHYTKAIIAPLISTTLTACGSGSSPEPTVTPPPAPAPVELTKIKGMAIDGYIVGATIFMDLNFNGVHSEFSFTEMIGASASDLSGGWLSGNLSHISLSFDDASGYNADFWERRDNRYASETFWEEDQVVHMHNADDEYTVTTYRPDGTHSKLCGTWSVGESSLVDCT